MADAQGPGPVRGGAGEQSGPGVLALPHTSYRAYTPYGRARASRGDAPGPWTPGLSSRLSSRLSVSLSRVAVAGGGWRGDERRADSPVIFFNK